MARGAPDEATYQPEVSPENLPRKVTPQMEPQTEIARGIGAIGGALEQKYNADSATWANNQLGTLHENALSSLKAMQSAQPADQDPTGFTPRYLKAFDELVKPLASAQGANPLAQRMLQRGVTQLRTAFADQSINWEAEQAAKYKTNSLYKSIDQAAAQVEADPTLKGVTGERLATTANAVGGDPGTRLELMRHIDSTLTLAEANGLTRQDPRGALTALNNPDKATGPLADIVKGLNDAQREAVRAKANEHLADGVYAAMQNNDFRGAQVALTKNLDVLDPKQAEALQRGINSAVESNIIRSEHAQKRLSDQSVKDGILLQKQGKLTDAWVEQRHNLLEPAAYEYLKKLESGRETVTDTPTYLQLLDRQTRGEDVREDAMRAAAGGLLDKSDAAKLLEGSARETPTYYKRGVEYIKTASQISLLEPDPAKAQSQANMLEDWNKEVDAHPEFAKDPAAAEASFRGIVSRYQLVDATKNQFVMDFPPYMRGTRMQPDLPGSKAALWQAFQNAQISKEEFDRRAAVIKQWSDTMDTIARNKAAAAKAAAANQ